jgi:hypothetical protein
MSKVIAKAKRGQLGESKEKKTPRVEVLFEFYADDAAHTIRWDGYLTDGALDRTLEALRTCGWAGDDLSDLAGIDTNEVELVIEQEEYEGKTYDRVKWVNAIGGGGFSSLEPAAQKTLAAQLKSKVRAFDAAKGVKTPTPTKTAAKPVEPDVPF